MKSKSIGNLSRTSPYSLIFLAAALLLWAAGGSISIADSSTQRPARDWCGEHGLPESTCTVCNPALASVFKNKGDWCGGHGFPESVCPSCNPATPPSKSSGPAKASTKSRARDWCGEHQMAESDCGICGPGKLAGLSAGQGLKIRLASAEAGNIAGIRSEPARVASLEEQEPVLARVGYDQNRLFRVSPLATGVIRRVRVDLGDRVEKGEVLLEVDSWDIARAKSLYLAALVDARIGELAHDREKSLVQKNISSEQDFQQARAERDRARIQVATTGQQLRNFGMTDREIKQIESNQSASSLLLIRSPGAGTIVEREAVVGQAVAMEQRLLTVVDLQQVWLELSIPEDQVSALHKGLEVRARFQSLAGEERPATLTWIDTTVDPRTRTVKARAELPNKDGRLRQGMFGEASVISKKLGQGILIERDSLVRLEGGDHVFIELDPTLYEIRRVQTGPGAGDRVSILLGLEPGERVASTGVFTLRSELYRSRLGAGCIDE